MTLAAALAVGHRKRVAAGFDQDGYPVPEAWADPVQRAVYGWYWEQAVEAGTGQSPDRTIDVLVILAPEPGLFAATDRVVVDGRELEVWGDPIDDGKGPFGYAPGGRVRARRVEG